MGGVYIRLKAEWNGDPTMIPVEHKEFDFWKNSKDTRVQPCAWGDPNILFIDGITFTQFENWRMSFNTPKPS
jgi:hypothetical protein